MAATSQQQPFQHNNNNNNGSNNSNNTEFNRQEIQTAIAKAVELRALHAALTQGNSPNPSPGPHNARFPSTSPASHFSAQDYPVFTPVSNLTYIYIFSFIFSIQNFSFISSLKWVFEFSYKKVIFLVLLI
jgi:hypothetical protein